MASFNKTIITNNGRSLIAKVLSGDQIKFTKMVSSSRDYTSSDLSQLTDLSNVEQTIVISSIKKTSDSAVKITGIFSNKDLKTGYKFKTVGLYAIDPDLGEILYSVTTASSVDDMPANTGIGLSSITIGLVTDVSNSNNASLEVSDVATVSALEFNEFKDEVNSHLNEIAKPNLLINGDFRIWQRGVRFEVSIPARQYHADRWRCFNQPNTTSIMEKTDSGIKHHSQGDGISALEYVFEIPNSIKGKKVTISYEIKSDKEVPSDFYAIKNTDVTLVITSKKFTCKQEYSIITHTFTVPTDVDMMTFWIDRIDASSRGSGVSFDIKWVKLELGNNATPFTPRLYGEELSLCQRYYTVLNYAMNTGGKIASQYANELNKVLFDVDLPTPMRILPTMTAVNTDSSGMRFVNSINLIQTMENTIEMLSSNPSNDVNNLLLSMRLSIPTTTATTGWVDCFAIKLDSEIY